VAAINTPFMRLVARQFSYDFPRPTLIMGILNVTPDSFSDGGRFLDTARAVAHGKAMLREGADWIDVGGESTRPGATPVEEEEEKRRVLPVIAALATEAGVPISIDTMKPAVAAAALEAGASVINDVAAARNTQTMWRLAAAAGAGYVCMHSQGTPQTMQQSPVYHDVVGEIRSFFQQRLEAMAEAGLALDQVMLDVGIGFGKTTEHNLQLLGALGKFTSLARPLLVGVSRKSFLGHLVGAEVGDRVQASVAGACLAVHAGASILRVHDVAETVQAVRVAEAIKKHSDDVV
jgi:dihydropteroate synthase